MAIVVRFKAKRQMIGEFSGTHYLGEHAGYVVPALKSRHIVTPRCDWSTRARLMFHGMDMADKRVMAARTETMLRAIGLDGHNVFADRDNEHVTIEPLGSGFMANVTIQLDI